MKNYSLHLNKVVVKGLCESLLMKYAMKLWRSCDEVVVRVCWWSSISKLLWRSSISKLLWEFVDEVLYQNCCDEVLYQNCCESLLMKYCFIVCCEIFCDWVCWRDAMRCFVMRCLLKMLWWSCWRVMKHLLLISLQ